MIQTTKASSSWTWLKIHIAQKLITHSTYNEIIIKYCRENSITNNIDEHPLHLVDRALVEYSIDKGYDFDSLDIENHQEQ